MSSSNESSRPVSVGEIDPNLRVETSLNLPETDWRDVRAGAFQLYGLCPPVPGDVFRRIPESVAAATSAGVTAMHTCTAGGRIRFQTDSPFVAMKVGMPNPGLFSHMTVMGTAGFDLYQVNGTSARFSAVFMPPMEIHGGYESMVTLPGGRVMRDLLVHMPLYSGVSELYIGLEAGAQLLPGSRYAAREPIVFYGSSITQGGCAARPGSAYTNLISRVLNTDHINLGFSGSACGEPAIVRHMASLSMSAFVCDYDHNAPTPEHLERTLWPLYSAIRTAHPDIPYLFVSKPDFRRDPALNARCRAVVRDAFERAQAAGDRKVAFVDGERLFDGPFYSECTVDTCHPTDLGFSRMAAVIGRQLADLLHLPFADSMLS